MKPIRIIAFLGVLTLTAFSEEGAVGARTRALFWKNVDRSTFGWFVFKEDYTPIWYCFHTPDAQYICSDTFEDRTQGLRVHVDVELDPLNVSIKTCDFGYSANFALHGKRVELTKIETLKVEKPNGTFAASVIVHDAKGLPHTPEEANRYSLADFHAALEHGWLEIESDKSSERASSPP